MAREDGILSEPLAESIFFGSTGSAYEKKNAQRRSVELHGHLSKFVS